MKLKKVFVAVVLLFGLARASMAQEKQEFMVTTAGGAYVHNKKDTTVTTRIDLLAKDTAVKVVAVEGNWVKVSLPAGKNGPAGREGYILSSLGTLKAVNQAAPKPVESDPIPARVAAPAPNPIPTAKAEAPTPAAQVQPTTAPVVSSTEPGQLGIGGTIGYGIVPLVTYDFSETNSVIASIMPSTNVLAFSAGVIHRFPQPDKKDSAKTSFFEPFVGGGVGFASATGLSAIGFYGTGGTFLTFKSHPNIRYVGIVNFIPYSGNVALGATVGAIYVFNK